MDALILAAGYATRLYPLTKNFPKPLLKVGARSILDRLVDDLDQIAEIDRIIVVSNDTFYQHFVDWKTKSGSPKDIILLNDGTTNNDNRLGAVKDILFTIEKLHEAKDLLVLAGDNVVDFSFGEFIRYAISKNRSCICCHHEPSVPALQKTGVLEADNDFKVIKLHEKPKNPPSHWAVPPFYVYMKKDFPLIKTSVENGCKPDAPGNLAGWLSSQTDVYAWPMTGSRYDIGDLKSYEAVDAIFKNKA
ncbi:sugar phosphate nucleotidyltransferase [Saccharicrinis sp. FJH2]|uniref:sugar phosphate nucleotidyltransferase n=1 Tax=Saccharicrinis sp. FJH65 TaxID=3344659 RepID=UPI0035F4DFCD